jgi:hypothetical protein
VTEILIVPSKLGDIGQFLVSSLKHLWETGKPPEDRNAYETKVFRKTPPRMKRKKNLESATQRQWLRTFGKRPVPPA